MINRYYGNTGRVERIPDRGDVSPPPPPLPPVPIQKSLPPQKGGSGMAPDLSRLLQRLSPGNLEQEDLLLLLVLYLLYRESGDRELLITMGALLFF